MKFKLHIPLIIWYAFLLILFLITSASCGSVAKNKDAKEIDTQSSIATSDSTKTKIVIREALNDSLKVKIGEIRTAKPECDSVCQVKIDEILSQIDSKKSSSKSELGFLYDKYKKTLIAYGKIQQSYDSIHSSSKVKNYKLKKTLTITKTLEKKLSKEEKINLWTGRIFWVILILFLGYRISKIFT